MGIKLGNLFNRKSERQQLLKREMQEHQKLVEKEDELKRLSEDVVWFKRLMAHNVRMPLAVIVGYGELLAEGGFSTREEEQECICKICKNIDYLDTVFKVLIDSQDEAFLAEKQHFDILGCVHEVAEYVKMIVQKAGIRISVNSSKKEVLFFGNRISLMRAFFNLIENSVRYMEREGNIFITVEETEREILIVYRDDGKGMKPEEAEKLITPGLPKAGGHTEGRGMGMYLIQQAVEEQGGSITLKAGEGVGVGVYMAFPKIRQKKL